MKIKILELIDGAKKAEGLTVIIDVFRAFTLETYLFAQGAEKIYPVGEMAEAFALKEQHPDWLLFGERGGEKVEGCDYGNSPSAIENIDFTGKTIIHSTSAGTQGIINATGADEIITACLTNARAVAEYIRARDPEVVSLVAMGNSGVRRANEDLLCAEYIQSILKNEPIAVTAAAEELKRNGSAEGRVRTTNEKTCLIIDAINNAINFKKKIAFKYFTYDGKVYQVDIKNGGGLARVLARLVFSSRPASS